MTPADFRAAFPAFEDAGNDDVQRHLDASISEGVFNITRWGKRYNAGLGNWVAHRLLVEKRHAMSQNDAALKGDVTGEINNGMTTMRSPDILKMVVLDRYNATSYGQEYLRLARRTGMGVFVGGCG